MKANKSISFHDKIAKDYDSNDFDKKDDDKKWDIHLAVEWAKIEKGGKGTKG